MVGRTVKSVYITGPSRSGTSMTAGLFAAHGVFFGDCQKPNDANGKGYYENLWLKRIQRNELIDVLWPDAWFERMIKEGWVGQPWGVKSGPSFWEKMSHTNPSVIVMCWRPMNQILNSRERIGWEGREHVVNRSWSMMRSIAQDNYDKTFHVETNLVIEGCYDDVVPIFETLGMPFNKSIADEWVDPYMWNRHKGT